MSDETWANILIFATWWVSSYAIVAFWMLWTQRRLPKHHEPRCDRWWTPTHQVAVYPKLTLLRGDGENKGGPYHQQDQETDEVPQVEDEIDVEVPKKHLPTAWGS